MSEPPNLSDLISERMSEMREQLTTFEKKIIDSEGTDSARYIQALSHAVSAHVLIEILIKKVAPDLIPAIHRAAENLERKLEEEEYSDQVTALRKGVIEVMKSVG